ncbi:MAG: C13 family peptidase [Candidatus Thermoplasmatota archaeon]|nr:C13 family peptidase [Candidatus Thermoplasmatota archaeon]
MKKKQIISILIFFICIANIPFQATAFLIKCCDSTDSQILPGELVDTTVYRAVLVAIDEYTYQPLPFSIKQLRDFRTTLLNSRNWYESNIYSFTDSLATKDAIKQRLAMIGEISTENDVTLFYFIGHGGRDFTNEFIRVYDEPIYDVELHQFLYNISGNIVVLLDSCYSGGFIKELGQPGRVIITACAKDEITYQVIDLESGIFGYFFNLCLSWLTKNAENTFYLTMLLTGIYEKKLTREKNFSVSFTPQMYDGISGPIYLINSHAYMNKIADLFVPLIQINRDTRLWKMNN